MQLRAGHSWLTDTSSSVCGFSRVGNTALYQRNGQCVIGADHYLKSL